MFFLVVTLLVLFARPAMGQSYLKRGYDTDGKYVLKAFAPVVAETRQSVVQFVADGKKSVLGTIVTADGLVLTKASEVRLAEKLTAKLSDGREVEAQLLAEDRLDDLALIQLDAEGLRPVAFELDAKPRLGQWVIVPGLDEAPEAVGVMSALPRRVNGVRLGISLFDHPENGRPVIRFAIPGMGAQAAGLQPGDVLRSIAGHEVNNSQDVIDSMQNVIAGDVIEVVVERRGKEMTFEVEMRLRELNTKLKEDYMNSMGNRMSERRDGFASVFQHDATLTPAECGGPLLDLDGRCIGINIARAGRIEAYTLPAEVVVESLEALTAQTMVKDDAPDTTEH
ncbi:S1C family serine protease [Algisphaera agarilytica]|uniref:Serine protease Do n=1 Tax=Algisphaera agarilytica TaxID=1385975 RepID=A0A7X0H841_9BACT|nr:S1C family serine protease [Algisphaera agarilytica]MBB6430807.1 serine protease Do [Algisphaera agarilytica]